MLRYLALIGLALATLPVYVLHGESVAPANTELDSEMVKVLVAHFTGSGEGESSLEALASAQLVPSTLFDSRNAAVVVVSGFDAAEAEKSLGSPSFAIKNPSKAPSVKPAALSTKDVAGLDNEAWPVVLVDGSDLENTLNALNQLDSKVLLIGVPASLNLPEVGYTKLAKRSSGSEAAAKSAKSARAALPASFESESECIKQTDSCSGRGKCVKIDDRYSCRCKTTKKNDYTYYWGGSDCSKQDVSFQFNLLAWTTVGIVGAAVAGIGLLFSVGSQPLPGILNVN